MSYGEIYTIINSLNCRSEIIYNSDITIILFYIPGSRTPPFHRYGDGKSLSDIFNNLVKKYGDKATLIQDGNIKRLSTNIFDISHVISDVLDEFNKYEKVQLVKVIAKEVEVEKYEKSIEKLEELKTEKPKSEESKILKIEELKTENSKIDSLIFVIPKYDELSKQRIIDRITKYNNSLKYDIIEKNNKFLIEIYITCLPVYFTYYLEFGKWLAKFKISLTLNIDNWRAILAPISLITNYAIISHEYGRSGDNIINMAFDMPKPYTPTELTEIQRQIDEIINSRIEDTFTTVNINLNDKSGKFNTILKRITNIDPDYTVSHDEKNIKITYKTKHFI